MKKSFIAFALAAICLAAEAQIQTPAGSPAGSVSTVVGLTDVKIDYFRPRVKGRKIFGQGPEYLLPYGTIWRTGANSGTKISFSDDVVVEGIAVPRGEYLIFTWPGETEWTVALYKDISLGGNTSKYDKAQEAANFKVKPNKVADKVETLTFNIGDIANDSKSAKVQLAWENTSVKFAIVTDYDKKVMASIEANTKVNSDNYLSAAEYYLENGKDLNKALEWINLAAQSDPKAFWITHQKAKIQKAMGDKKGALASAQLSLDTAKKNEGGDFGYVKLNEDLMKTLK